jgi:hypothetical protein
MKKKFEGVVGHGYGDEYVELTAEPTILPYGLHDLHIGMRVVESQDWFVIKKTAKSVTIKMRSEKDMGYKVGKPLTFRWDGKGFIRQKQYLRSDGIY